MTWSTWAPQPDQLARPQERHVVREHMRWSLAPCHGWPVRSAPLAHVDDDTEGYPMSINRTRGSLYKLARILGDVQAVRKGRVGKRIGRRVVGRYAGRGMGRLFR